MIVITGPGRSGTSLLARVYQQAGVDPGGVWSPEIRAGYEDPSVVQLNKHICHELGASLTGVKADAPDIASVLPGGLGADWLKARLSSQARYRMKRVYEKRPWNTHRRFMPIRWAKVPRLAESLRDELIAFADSRSLVKDPLFSLTMPVWLAAGADIEHTIVTFRNLGPMIESRTNAGHLGYRRTDDAKNAMTYAFGVCVSSLHCFAVPMSLLRFPDFAKNPADVWDRLPLPPTIDRPAFRAAFEEVIDLGMTSRSFRGPTGS